MKRRIDNASTGSSIELMARNAMTHNVSENYVTVRDLSPYILSPEPVYPLTFFVGPRDRRIGGSRTIGERRFTVCCAFDALRTVTL